MLKFRFVPLNGYIHKGNIFVSVQSLEKPTFM